MVFQSFLKVNKRLIVHFHYHLKCQDITDNEGDIELESMESSQNTFCPCNVLKLRVLMRVDGISNFFECK